jgi:exopolyphosphatase/guanosine-5'-triphosphate,3'-diphosphate pyrophosphatase
MGAFTQVLRGAYGAADHHERALMATAVYYRYAGDGDFPEETGVGGLLGAEGAVMAQQIGLAERLGFGLSGALEGELREMNLLLSKDSLVLEVPSAKKALLAETVNKRLSDLADAFGRKSQTAVV